jgi:hypothetical protein
MRSTCTTELAVFKGDAASRPSMAGLRKRRPFADGSANGQIDPLLSFQVGSLNVRKARETGFRLKADGRPISGGISSGAAYFSLAKRR